MRLVPAISQRSTLSRRAVVVKERPRSSMAMRRQPSEARRRRSSTLSRGPSRTYSISSWPMRVKRVV